MFKEPTRNAVTDQDVLSQLTALRQQLKNEEKRVQQQMNGSSAVVSLNFRVCLCHGLNNASFS